MPLERTVVPPVYESFVISVASPLGSQVRAIHAGRPGGQAGNGFAVMERQDARHHAARRNGVRTRGKSGVVHDQRLHGMSAAVSRGEHRTAERFA